MRFTVLLSAILFVSSALADCPAPPPAQRDIIADGYYDDPPVYSHIDPVRHTAYEAAVGPLEAYLHTVAKLASNGEKECALRWLVSWAEGDAMLGTIKKEQAHYERKWLLSGLALSYAKVRDDASRDQKAAIDTWLQALADGVMAHSNAYKGERNNHYYWEGLAVGATGAVTGNAKDLAWGRKVFRDAMANIADDGTLPRELSRGGRAFHYHLFAAAPLAMLESILDEHSPKMDKLAGFCIQAFTLPGVMEKRAGAIQIGVLSDDADWLAVFFRRHHRLPDTKIMRAIPISDKPYVSRLGGSLDTANPLEHPLKN
jgi:poly(beta-D-mannuronate) lyase